MSFLPLSLIFPIIIIFRASTVSSEKSDFWSLRFLGDSGCIHLLIMSEYRGANFLCIFILHDNMILYKDILESYTIVVSMVLNHKLGRVIL